MLRSDLYDYNVAYIAVKKRITAAGTSNDSIRNKKYNCSGPLEFKSHTVGYQSNKKLLHHYQHSKNQLNSRIH